MKTSVTNQYCLFTQEYYDKETFKKFDNILEDQRTVSLFPALCD